MYIVKEKYMTFNFRGGTFDSLARAGVNSVVLLKCIILFVKGSMTSSLKENIYNFNNDFTYVKR
jgi:hypothetical protein